MIGDLPAAGLRCEWSSAAASAAASTSSCGLDFWQSPEGLAWSCSYLHATAAVLTVLGDHAQASITCLVRALPGGFKLASCYPYADISGNVDLFWGAVPTISAALRQKRILRLELAFSGPYARQLHLDDHAGRAKRLKSLTAVRHVLDMSGLSHDEVDQHFHANTRWATRKARRNGCSVRAAGPTEVDALQGFYAHTMRAKKAPVNYGVERWRGIAATFAPQGRGQLYMGEIDGQPRGMAAAVDSASSRHLIQLAVPPDAHSSRLGELLVATAIHDAKDKGLRYFDFMASPASDTGLIAFKSKWGTVEEPIAYVAITGYPGLEHMVDLARWGNQVMAHIRGT